MIDHNNQSTFRLRRDFKLWILVIAISLTLLLFAVAVLEGGHDSVEFIFLTFPLFLMVWSLFIVKLTITDQGIRYSLGFFTYASDWEGIVKVTDVGLITADPCITYKKWAALFVWRILFWHPEPEFVRTIQLKSFDKNWIDGEIGRQVSKHIPKLVYNYRHKPKPSDVWPEPTSPKWPIW